MTIGFAVVGKVSGNGEDGKKECWNGSGHTKTFTGQMVIKA